jgi:hypothetical protein
VRARRTPLREAGRVTGEYVRLGDRRALGGVDGEGVGVVEVLFGVLPGKVHMLPWSVRIRTVPERSSRSATAPRVPLRTPRSLSLRRVTTRSATATGPVLIGSVGPRTPRWPRAFGWNNGPVTANFDCTDALSGAASCTDPVTLSAERAAQQVTVTLAVTQTSLGNLIDS